MKRHTVWLALLTCLSLRAEIHSYIDASGERVFTDRPPASASTTTVTPRTTNRMPAGQRMTKLSPPPGSLPASAVEEKPGYSQLQVLHPQPDATLRNTARSIELEVSSTPALMPGHSYQLWLDGAPYGPSSTGTRWSVGEVDRGTHSLQVQLLDASGHSLIQSETLQVHVHQTSLASRRRVKPCQADDYGVRLECPLKDKPPVPKQAWWRFGR